MSSTLNRDKAKEELQVIVENYQTRAKNLQQAISLEELQEGLEALRQEKKKELFELYFKDLTLKNIEETLQIVQESNQKTDSNFQKVGKDMVNQANVTTKKNRPQDKRNKSSQEIE